uniref:hypothetical protein n=1 Tax=Candidatus Limisoma sp. TaxID=3076476 RepID=UPI003FF030D4
MNKLEYPEVSLYKLRLLSKGEESLIVTRRDEKQHFYNVSLDTIGKYYSLEEAEAALKTHKETDKDVIVYQIIGPEHGHGNSTFVESEIDGIPDEIFETEDYDESPEFQMVFNATREFISSYFYDANNPGGASLENENTFIVGDMAWMSGSCCFEEEELNVLIPVIIESMVQNKHRLNIESDGVKVKPLVTVKCNWGEYPDSEGYEIPRIDLLPHNIIKQ